MPIVPHCTLAVGAALAILSAVSAVPSGGVPAVTFTVSGVSAVSAARPLMTACLTLPSSQVRLMST